MKWKIEYFEQADTTQPAAERELKKAFTYWIEYIQTRRISPTQEEDK